MTAQITTEMQRQWNDSQYVPDGELNEFWQTDAVARELLSEMGTQEIADRASAVVANIERQRRPRARKAIGQADAESAIRAIGSSRTHRQLSRLEHFWMMDYALHNIKRELEG